MVRALLSVLSPEERAALDSAAAHLNSTTTAAAAKAIEHIADSLAARVQKQDIDAAAVLRAVAGNIQRIADGGVNAAEQATMTLDALGTNSEATAPLVRLSGASLAVPPERVRGPLSKGRRKAMRRSLEYVSPSFLVVAAPLGAQRAQLARKGRQVDAGRPPAFRSHPKTTAPHHAESPSDSCTCAPRTSTTPAAGRSLAPAAARLHRSVTSRGQGREAPTRSRAGRAH